MESTVLNKLIDSANAAGSIEPQDIRDSLVNNPNGKKWKKRDPEKLKGMVWHQGLGWGSVEAVAKYHTGPDSHLYDGGVESIAYTWAIRENGEVVLCNDFNKRVWSQGYKGRTGDENAEFISVMFQGFFKAPGVTDPSAGEPNNKQLAAGRQLWDVCKEVWELSDDDLYGHYHFGKPACPGNRLKAEIESIRINAQDIPYDFSTVNGRQQALKALGYYKDEVDGMWGPVSRGALIRFQSDSAISADGVWGENTEAAIIEVLKS